MSKQEEQAQEQKGCPNLGLSESYGTHGEGLGRAGSEPAMEGLGQYMTMQEAASMLKVGVRTLYRYLDSGRICRSYRLPGKRLLAREDVLAFMEHCADQRAE